MESGATSAAARITFRKLCDVNIAQIGPVVHVKGFASGIDFSQPAVSGAVEALCRFVDELQPWTIAFDGDHLEHGSFTQVVRRLAECGTRALLAFKYESPGAEEGVRRSWCDTSPQMTGVLVPAWEGEDMFVQLGKTALECTGGKIAVCLGGGQTTATEASQTPGVQFHVWPIARTLKDGSIQECQVSGELENVTLHTVESITSR